MAVIYKMEPKVHTEFFSESVTYTNKDGEIVKEHKKHHEVDGKTVEHVDTVKHIDGHKAVEHQAGAQAAIKHEHHDKPKVHTETYSEADVYTNKGGHVVHEHAHEARKDGKVVDKDHYKEVDGQVKAIGEQGHKAVHAEEHHKPKVHSEVYFESTVVTGKDGHFVKEHKVDHKIDGKTVEHEHTINKDGEVKQLKN